MNIFITLNDPIVTSFLIKRICEENDGGKFLINSAIIAFFVSAQKKCLMDFVRDLV